MFSASKVRVCSSAEQQLSQLKILPMNRRVESRSSIFIPIVDINTPIDEIIDYLERSRYPFLLRKQLLARMRQIGDILRLDEQSN